MPLSVALASLLNSHFNTRLPQATGVLDSWVLAALEQLPGGGGVSCYGCFPVQLTLENIGCAH